jgi:methylamine---glutamate N-methyltransferase subunit B
MTGTAAGSPLTRVADSVLPVPEIRDYERINAELKLRLDGGQSYIRLIGAEGQRLLLAGLAGDWPGLIEIEGRTGPELAASMDAPGLTVVARGPTGDGAGRGLRGGTLVVLGDAGDALGYALEGGRVLAAARAGHRVGLGQRGGLIVVLGPLGRLAGERQTGGRLFAHAGCLGPYAGHGHRGGSFHRLGGDGRAAPDPDLAPEEAEAFRRLLGDARPWIGAISPAPP